MEQKTIQFNKGIHRSPSQALEDGELSECVNLIPKNGELVNAPVATPVGLTLTSDQILRTIHTGNDFKHYIIINFHEDTKKTYIAWIDAEDETYTAHEICECSSSDIDIKQMGNVLVYIDENGLNYIWWHNTSYMKVDGIQDIDLEFLLSCEIAKETFSVPEMEVNTGGISVYKNIIYKETVVLPAEEDVTSVFSLTSETTYLLKSPPGEYHELSFKYVGPHGGDEDIVILSDDNNYTSAITIKGGYSFTITQSPIRESGLTIDVSTCEIYTPDCHVVASEDNFNELKARIAEFNATYIKEKKRFIYPFFARYGIELYDGSIIHQSAPVLMVPNWGAVVPLCRYDKQTRLGHSFLTLTAFSSALFYRIKSTHDIIEKLQQLKDIVKGIVIAISPAIKRYNEGAEYFSDIYDINGYSNCNDMDVYSISGGHVDSISSPVDSIEEEGEEVTTNIRIPSFSDETFKEKILGSSQFYVVKRINIDKLPEYNVRTKLSFEDIDISALETLTRMEDDFNSRNVFNPKSLFVYNNRLSLCCIEETIKFANNFASPCYYNTSGAPAESFAYLYFSDDTKECIHKIGENVAWQNILWLYASDSSAKKIVLYYKTISDDTTKYYRAILSLTGHDSLNGCYWCDVNPPVFSEISASEYNVEEATDDSITENHPNYIYTSAVNNPFYFPAELQDTIGSGEIKAVTTSAKALSQGQFGQFPLYAFCTDGIWALSVGSTGKYSTTNPVSRDVVENVASICQIDSAVVFATAQGLKLLEGSETALLSGVMNGENTDESNFLSGLDENHSGLVVSDTNSFVNMLSEAKAMYDYTNLLIHIYPSDCATTGKHYVYSLESKEFSGVVDEDSKVVSVVHGYPYSTMQTSEGLVKQFQPTDDKDTLRNGIILTRPVSVDSPFAMKIIMDMKLFYRKTKADTKCKYGIFGSNDCLNWYKVKSLKARSWKWYRFRIQTHMTDQDAFSAMTMLYDLRRTNKLR